MANLKLIKPLGVQNIINKFCFTIGMIPSSYKLSLTYEEQILSIGKYLEETVIPALNNNAEAVAELQALFVQLKDYVENYFDNLDVQNEINNKIEAMAQNGELQEIIAQYLNTKSLLCFDNIEDMISSQNLIEGSFAKTFGFHQLNDGGNKVYKIIKEQNAQNVNGRSKINLLRDDLYAISLNDKINVKEYGAKGDGVQDDTEAIQFCIDNFSHRTIYFPDGDYLISSPLNIKTGNEFKVDLYLQDNARIFTNSEIESLLNIGKISNGTWNRSKKGNIVTIYGGIFDATNTTNGIYITADRKQTRILHTNIINVSKTGIFIDRQVSTTTSISSDCLLDTISITGTGNFDNAVGIHLYGTDNELNEIRITGIKTAMIIDGGGNLISNCHFTIGFANTTVEMINECIGCQIKGFGNNYFDNLYIDTFGKCIVIENENMRSFFNNFQVFWWLSNENSKSIVFDLYARSYIYCTNSFFEMPENGVNQVVNLNNAVDYNTRKYPVIKGILNFMNCTAIRVSNDNDLFNEMSINYKFDGKYTPNSNPWTIAMQQNQYYKLMLLSGGIHKFNIQIANDQISEVEINVNSANPSIRTKDIHHSTGGHFGKYEIALVNGFTDNVDNYYAYLAIRATDRNSSFNPSISNLQVLWLNEHYACASSTPLVEPIVHINALLDPNAQ